LLGYDIKIAVITGVARRKKQLAEGSYMNEEENIGKKK